MVKKLVINLYGAPNSGKTVAATGIFNKLKKQHLDCLLVTEAAKDFVIESNAMAFKNQFYIWSTQQHRIFCAHEHAQVIVTDSPLLLGMVYQTDCSPAMQQVILEEHQKYDNLNIMLPLDASRPYSMAGRAHSLTESISLNNQIIDVLESHDIPYLDYASLSEDEIIELILAML